MNMWPLAIGSRNVPPKISKKKRVSFFFCFTFLINLFGFYIQGKESKRPKNGEKKLFRTYKLSLHMPLTLFFIFFTYIYTEIHFTINPTGDIFPFESFSFHDTFRDLQGVGFFIYLYLSSSNA